MALTLVSLWGCKNINSLLTKTNKHYVYYHYIPNSFKVSASLYIYSDSTVQLIRDRFSLCSKPKAPYNSLIGSWSMQAEDIAVLNFEKSFFVENNDTIYDLTFDGEIDTLFLYRNSLGRWSEKSPMLWRKSRFIYSIPFITDKMYYNMEIKKVKKKKKQFIKKRGVPDNW